MQEVMTLQALPTDFTDDDECVSAEFQMVLLPYIDPETTAEEIICGVDCQV
jgi:hypothetical protein